MAIELPEFGIWEQAVALFTFFSSNILAVIQQPTWPLWLRKVTFALFHLVIAVIYLGAAGKLDGANLSVTFSLIFTYGVASYLGAWKPLADKIEVATSGFTDQGLRKLGLKRNGSPLTTPKARASSTVKDVMANGAYNGD